MRVHDFMIRVGLGSAIVLGVALSGCGNDCEGPAAACLGLTRLRFDPALTEPGEYRVTIEDLRLLLNDERSPVAPFEIAATASDASCDGGTLAQLQVASERTAVEALELRNFGPNRQGGLDIDVQVTRDETSVVIDQKTVRLDYEEYESADAPECGTCVRAEAEL